MIKQILGQICNFSLDILAPRTCPACGRRLVESENAICLSCLTMLPRTGYCGMHTPLRETVDNGVAEPGLCAAWFFYDHRSPFADIIRAAKFSDRPALARILGSIFAQELMLGLTPLGDIDVLLPVPMHWTKRLRRGYNQSHEIALGISDVTGTPVADNLVASKAHRTQSLQSARTRLGNLEGKMTVRFPEELDGLHVAIVDDIITTGATVRECVRAISASGARPASIGVLALATGKR